MLTWGYKLHWASFQRGDKIRDTFCAIIKAAELTLAALTLTFGLLVMGVKQTPVSVSYSRVFFCSWPNTFLTDTYVITSAVEKEFHAQKQKKL